MAGEEEEVLALSTSGYMFKQGGTRKSWKKRYFELSEGKILYYKSEDKQKLKGTLHLTEAWGVRSKNDCTCDWPVGLLPSKCFGLALKDRTYYFYSNDENLEDWVEHLQTVVNVIGDPNDDPSKDHHGKPEGSKSKIARGAVSLGAKATKVAMAYAPVDDTVKDLVSAGADLVADQAEADPDASIAERLQIGANTFDEMDEDDTEDIAQEITDGVIKAIKKEALKPPPKALAKVAPKSPAAAAKGGKSLGKMAGGLGKAAGKAKDVGKVADLASKAPTKDVGKAMGKAAAKGAGKAAAKGLAKGAGKAATKGAAKGMGKGLAKGATKGVGKGKLKMGKPDVKKMAKSAAGNVLEACADDEEDYEQ